MKVTILIKTSLLTLLMGVSAAVGLLASPQVATAATCPQGSTASSSGVCKCPDGQQLVSVPVDDGTFCVPINENSAALTDNPIFFYLRYFLRFLAGGVGLAVVGGIVAGAYLYITARANASQVQQGQTMITNSVIGLLLFIFMFAILQFIIPGGVFQ